MAAVVKNKVCLVVIDGWGISKETKGNAISNAKTPFMSRLAKEYAFTEVAAHGLNVGLPDGLMGNSEVGHMNIGAGRAVYQDIVRIDLSIEKKTILKNENILRALEDAKKKNGRIHLLGLVSDGGVHSHIKHLKTLLDICKQEKVPKTFVHFFSDGRDTSPQSCIQYCKDLQDHMSSIRYSSIATMMGRYYAMDRDKRWDRIKIAYEGMVGKQGEICKSSSELISVIEKRYQQNENDEFLKPILVDLDGQIQNNDTLLFFNFRSDRMREIVETFGFPSSKLPFETSFKLDKIQVHCMTQYSKDYPFPVIFPPQSLENVLSEWISKKGLSQFHTAETEKYAHVTFFFNGGQEKEFEKEFREMVPSPKVATYDLKPEMNSFGVAESVVKQIQAKVHPFIMCNFAPPDMVGHTGNYDKAIEAVQATDSSIGIIYEACKKNGYTLFITADHGNAEKMMDETTGQPHTAHTCNPVPFIMTSKDKKFNVKNVPQDRIPSLCDVAPTILHYMGLDIPKQMEGTSLLA